MRWDNVVSLRDSRAFCFEIKAGSSGKNLLARRRRGRTGRSSSQQWVTVRNGDDELVLVGGPMLDHQQRGPRGLAPKGLAVLATALNSVLLRINSLLPSVGYGKVV